MPRFINKGVKRKSALVSYRNIRPQHGCLLKFGRVSTFRFVDPAQENLLNHNLSQSQHFGSGSIYDR